MDIKKLSAIEIREKVLAKELSAESVVKVFIEQMEANKKYNAVLEIFYDAVDKAKELDEKVAKGFSGKLAGVPIVIKDNIMYEGKICSCSSKRRIA